MYNEKIENLINFALADGELTEKEKQILLKKNKTFTKLINLQNKFLLYKLI
jgi:hypothetical protein